MGAFNDFDSGRDNDLSAAVKYLNVPGFYNNYYTADLGKTDIIKNDNKKMQKEQAWNQVIPF